MSAEDRMVAVLAEHREDPTYPNTCSCEVTIPDGPIEGHYATHVAAMLRPVLAEVWDDAIDYATACVDDEAREANPHRESEDTDE